MRGVSIDIDLQGIERLNQGIEQMRGLGRNRELFDVIGSVVESQTKNRIANEKTDSDGNDWMEWSEEYAKTRHSNHSLLMNEGNLEHSISFDATDTNVAVGSNRVYAAVQHEMRPFLGVSTDNWEELSETIEDFIGGLLQ